MALSFEDVGAAALASALILLPEWMGGQRRGHEWLGERKANGGIGDSWTVNLNTGAWMHGAGSERGGDLIALYAALNHINNGAALKQVAALVGVTEGRQAPKLPRTKAPERRPEPIPEDAPDPAPHPTNGVASACYRYGRAFAVTRYDLANGKTFAQWTWRNGKWDGHAYPAPKPAYHAELLPKHPQAPVLIVEGEKCADIAAHTLKKYVCMTWAGGSSAVKHTDWTCLEGRDVIIWPDADDPGSRAGAQLAGVLANIASRVRVVQPNGQQPPGWDIADAVSEGMDAKQIAKWAGDHIVTTVASKEPTPAAAVQEASEPSVVAMTEGSGAATAEPATPDDAAPIDAEFLPAKNRKRDEDYPDGQPPRSNLVIWKDLRLAVDNKDVPHPTLSNASMIIRFHPKYKEKIWWDDFRERIFHTVYGPTPREWNDVDTKRLTTFIQQELQLPKFSLKLLEDAIGHAAHENERNSVQEWLESLEWDSHERLSTWVGDCLGVVLTPYSMAVGRNWIISMIARAYVPGVQADHMPVLEGTQGEGKSSALEILGDRWFAAVSTAFGSNEFIQSVQGKWLIEIPDMAGFSRRDHGDVISTITKRTDRYRMKYGRFDQDHKRKCIFAATSETDDYLPEMRGIRRYWPLRCKGIDLEVLRGQREQIFAEALRAYKDGEAFYKMPVDDTSAEQRARNSEDPWTEDVLMYCQQRERAGHPVHPVKILTDAIAVEKKDLNQSNKLRISNILKAHGWIPKTIDNVRQYVKPIRVSVEDKP